MNTSFVRGAVAAFVLIIGAPACVQQSEMKATSSPSIQFAVETDSVLRGIRVGAVRTIASSVNVAEPPFVGFEQGRPLVTFAQHQRDGKAVTLDESLSPVSETERTYPARANGEQPAHLAQTRATVRLRDGRSLSVWTDEATGRVLAEVDGLLPVVVHGGDVVGCPHAASADGQHVVVTFAASTDHGFDLMAASIDAR